MSIDNEGEEVQDEVSLELILVLAVALAIFIFVFKQCIRCLRQLNLYVAGRKSPRRHYVALNDEIGDLSSVLESAYLDEGSEVYKLSKWCCYNCSSTRSSRKIEGFNRELYD